MDININPVMLQKPLASFFSVGNDQEYAHKKYFFKKLSGHIIFLSCISCTFLLFCSLLLFYLEEDISFSRKMITNINNKISLSLSRKRKNESISVSLLCIIHKYHDMCWLELLHNLITNSQIFPFLALLKDNLCWKHIKKDQNWPFFGWFRLSRSFRPPS